MAKKKSRSRNPKKPKKTISKKKPTTRKSGAASSTKQSGRTNKSPLGKTSSKRNRKGQAGSKKTTLTAKKSALAKSSGQQSAAKAVRRISHRKQEPSSTSKMLLRTPARSASSSIASAGSQTGREGLTPTERYNVGGLFACAIDRASDPDFKRLRAIFRHLNLSSQDKDNLLRLSQGMMIPKLFADSVDEHKVSLALMDVIGFASAEGAYEKKWRNEIRQVGRWLGLFPEQFNQIEQRVLKT